MSWQFTPFEKRLSITLPKEYGGKTHQVCLTGGYTFTPVTDAVVSTRAASA